jgi:tripartite-type tricarboxylate transporter receptor subunit TctC
LPTVAASGVPGYEAVGRTGIWAPAKTSAAIINRLNQEIVRALRATDVKEKFFGVGMEILATTPEQLAVTMQSEMAVIGRLIKDLGLKVE